MGEPSGFLRWQRSDAPLRSPIQRVRDDRELLLERRPTEVTQQAGRCMDCGVPFCHRGCPLGNHIPEWNDAVYRDRWRDAWQQLAATNEFPEFTGRLCPAPCEAACVLAVNDEPVTIEQIEKEIAERAFAQGWVQPRPPSRRSGFRVAVVGSGPAGLAAAARLNRVGHQVTVFERDDAIGGLLRYGIPDFKLERAIIDRRLDVLAAEGVAFRTGVCVGQDPAWAELRADHDAVVIAIGAGKARELTTPGRDLSGVHLAMDYLVAHNRFVARQGEGRAGDRPDLDANGRDVIVLGGGDTGADCVGTAHRQGARSVRQVELMAAPPADRPVDNPWPQWPRTLRTSTSHAEGGERLFGLRTIAVEAGGGGRVAAIRTVPFGAATGQGDAPVERLLPCDMLLLAMGFVGPTSDVLVEQLGLELDERGRLATKKWMSSAAGVFVAGDARVGASLVVTAIAEGIAVAEAVERYLAETCLAR